MNKEQQEEKIARKLLDAWYFEEKIKGGKDERITNNNTRDKKDMRK